MLWCSSTGCRRSLTEASACLSAAASAGNKHPQTPTLCHFMMLLDAFGAFELNVRVVLALVPVSAVAAVLQCCTRPGRTG